MNNKGDWPQPPPLDPPDVPIIGRNQITIEWIMKWKSLRRTVSGVPHEKVEAVINAMLDDHAEYLIDPSSLQ